MPMYSFEYALDGIKYTVFLFSTFTGHFHPFTPYNPIDVDQAFSQERKTFYLAWYAGDRSVQQNEINLKNAKLYFFEKYWLVFARQEPLKAHRQEAGRYFHSVKEVGGAIVIGPEIVPMEAIKSNLLYTYKVDDKMEIVESNIVKKGLMDKYSYTYKSAGAMEKVDIYRSAPPGEN